MEPARLQFFRSGNLRIALPSLCFGGHLMVRTGMVAGLDCRLPSVWHIRRIKRMGAAKVNRWLTT